MMDPNFWQSEDVARLSRFARLLLLGMISNADDQGRGRANVNYLKSTVFPYDEVQSDEVAQALKQIGEHIAVALYDVEGSSYYAFTNWGKWQKVDKPRASVIPLPPEQARGERGEWVANESRMGREWVATQRRGIRG